LGSCAGRSPGRKGTAAGPWAPAFAGALIPFDSDQLYLGIHLIVGFTLAYLLTGSVQIAGGIALIEPCINAVAFFFHEKAWKRVERRAALDPFVRDAVAHG